mgnify:CR=1 FL=1
MANLIREHRIVDTNRRALIKYICISDGTQLANSTLVDVSTLAYALNANGYIMSSNTHPKSIYRTNISRIKGATNIGSGSTGYLKLQWQGATNSEIIVVDNASTDGSSSFLKNKFNEVEFIWNNENIGFSKANNLALKKVTGDYILFLNAIHSYHKFQHMTHHTMKMIYLGEFVPIFLELSNHNHTNL